MTRTAAALYDTDYVRWTQEQAGALREAGRAGTNAPIDWENLAEEVDSLGRSELRELESRVATILEHLLKLAHSPARDPRAGWRATLVRERQTVARILRDSPSLAPKVEQIVTAERAGAARAVAEELTGRGEIDPTSRARLSDHPYSTDQVLGDWFPEEPA